jgi:uncharacterized integral membrane protein (TIGR00698 family)
MSWQKGVFFLVLIFLLSPYGSPAVALALGLAIALLIGTPFPSLSGKPSKYLLQISVAMLGFGMDLGSIVKAGRDGIVLIVAVVFGTLIVGYLIGRALGVTSKIRTLVSCGTAICGGSAIAAVGPAIKAENDEMSVSLGTVFVLNAVALFAFPIIGHSLGLTDQQFGMWAGVAIQDTSSVVGAATSYGGDAFATATTVKLARTLWIIPLAIGLAFAYRDGDGKAKVTLPWFIFFFLGAAAARTYGSSIVLPSLFDALVNLAKAGLLVTLFLIGLSLSKEMLRNVGWRPFALGTILWAIIAAGSLWTIVNLI